MKKISVITILALSWVVGLTSFAAYADEAPTKSEPQIAAPAENAAATSAAEPAAAAPTEPQLVTADKISSGDTAWMLTSSGLVLFMTIPGLALFYAGMVRKKNLLATIMQSFAITCVVSVLWWAVGYSLAFTPGSTPYLGGLSRLFMHGMRFVFDAKTPQLTVSHLALTIPESVYAMFQMTFAIITPALICGAFAERMKFSAMLIFMAIWSVVVYAPVAHWVWEPSGWLATLGVLDYAGGTVVHINAGIAALVCALVLGKRIGYGREFMAPHNLALTMIGASMLWVGWFGFNAGSAVAADGRAGMAMMVTQLATAAAALGWMFIEWILKGKPSVLGIASGAVAGLVAITPASGFVDPSGSMIIGLAAGVVCYFSATSLKHALGYDDSLDAFGVHCVGGILGALLTGVFANKEISGQDASVATQAIGVACTLIYSGVVSYILLKIIDMTIGLRVSEEDERMGLDVSLHGEHVE
jgi:ammonium transporter, Amt family